jgi:hypothetical protein
MQKERIFNSQICSSFHRLKRLNRIYDLHEPNYSAQHSIARQYR